MHFFILLQLCVIPCFADKHHPVALVLIRCHNVEFQHIVVVHLKEKCFLYCNGFALTVITHSPTKASALTFHICGVSFSGQSERSTLLQCWPTIGPKQVLGGMTSRGKTPKAHFVRNLNDGLPNVFLSPMCYLYYIYFFLIHGILINSNSAFTLI